VKEGWQQGWIDGSHQAYVNGWWTGFRAAVEIGLELGRYHAILSDDANFLSDKAIEDFETTSARSQRVARLRQQLLDAIDAFSRPTEHSVDFKTIRSKFKILSSLMKWKFESAKPATTSHHITF
jgi:hypothetical protein